MMHGIEPQCKAFIAEQAGAGSGLDARMAWRTPSTLWKPLENRVGRRLDKDTLWMDRHRSFSQLKD